MSTRIDVAAVDDDDDVDAAAPAMVSGATATATARRRGGRASGARDGGYGGGAGAASVVAATPRLDDFTDEENAARFIRKNRWVALDVGPFPVRVCGDEAAVQAVASDAVRIGFGEGS